MKRIKPVYFPDQRGFLLTFGPEDDQLYRWTARRSSEEIRKIFGTDEFAAIQSAAAADGVRSWMRGRLRSAMERESQNERPGTAPLTSRSDGWPELDIPAAAHIERLLDTYAPAAARVLDPFGGSGISPVVASQRDAEAFWCEINPARRFLAIARFRALYREDTDRRRLADELVGVADSLPSLVDHATEQAEPGTTSRGLLEWIAHRDQWTSSGLSRDLFRAAVVSLLADGEPLDPQNAADELRRLARYIGPQRAMLRFPVLLAEDAADLASMRSVHADVLLATPPVLNSQTGFSAAADAFLSGGAEAERAGQSVRIPRGRATALYLERAMRELWATADLLPEPRGRSAVHTLVAVVKEIDEPGKAAIAASSLASLVRTTVAIDHHLAAGAVAIINATDSWFAGRLIPNVDLISDLFSLFGFDEVMRESSAEARRVLVMRRSVRPSRPSPGWAAWA